MVGAGASGEGSKAQQLYWEGVVGNQLDGFRFTLRAFAQQNGWMVEAEFVAGKVRPAISLAYLVICMCVAVRMQLERISGFCLKNSNVTSKGQIASGGGFSQNKHYDHV